MAQFFQGSGVASDQGQQLQEAAKQVALIAQQKRQLDQAQQLNNLKQLAQMREQFSQNAKAAGMPETLYAQGPGKLEWEAITRAGMSLSGQGGTPLRNLLGLGPTKEAVQAQASEYGAEEYLSPRDRLLAGMSENFRRGPIQAQAPAPTTPARTLAAATTGVPQAAAAPIKAPVAPDVDLSDQRTREAAAAKLVDQFTTMTSDPNLGTARWTLQDPTTGKPALGPAGTPLVYRSRDDAIRGLAAYFAQVQENPLNQVQKDSLQTIVQQTANAQTESDRLRGMDAARQQARMSPAVASVVEPPTTTQTTNAPQTSFRDWMRAKGITGIAATGTPEKDAALQRANPNSYATYLKEVGGEASTPAPTVEQKKVDKAAEELNKATTSLNANVEARAAKGLEPSAGNKFHQKVVAAKQRNYAQALRDASTEEISAIAKEYETWIKNTDSATLEAYGLSDISNKKQQQEVLQAQAELLFLKDKLAADVEAGKIKADILKEYNEAEANVLTAWNNVYDAWHKLAPKKTLAQFIADNPRILDSANSATKQQAEITGISQKTLTSVGKNGFFSGLFGNKPNIVESGYYYPGLGGDIGQTGGGGLVAPTTPSSDEKYRNLANK